MTPEAFLFDLDGTLVDNMPIHQEAFDAFAARHGLPPLTPELRRRLDGKRNQDIFPILFDRPLAPEELRRYAEEKESLYRALSLGRLRPLPGLLTLLELLAARGLRAGIATSAPARNVAHTLGELGLAARFPVVVRSEEVPRGKPHADVFLELARRLDAAPERCLAFEDSPIGLQAARAAGLRAIGIATTFGAEVLGPLAEAVVPDYEAWLAGPGAWLRA